MTTKTVFQIDRAGMYLGETMADASPLEAGVWLMPAGTIETAPPDTWGDTQWPRWNGAKWELVTRPTPVDPSDTLAALERQASELMAQIAALKATL